MRITCLSDLHGEYPTLKGGDLLLIAGDLTGGHTRQEFECFCMWVRCQNFSQKIVVAGNHDGFLQENPTFFQEQGVDIDYLCDAGTKFEGLNVWGSPWTKTFPGCNPHCKAFTVETDEELAEKWGLIPSDTDILLTHCPPFGLLDGIENGWDGTLFHAGSLSLRKALDRIQPPLHVFGHIHAHGGKKIIYKHIGPNTCCVNGAYMDETYDPINPICHIIL